jgi:hypothetical protein
MSRHVVVILLAVLVMAALLRAAGEDTRRAQVAAATADALASLRRDVAAAQIAPSLTVGQFLEKTKSDDDLTEVLREAEKIGGTRWLDDKTCQVRLELPGGDVADALIAIAAAHPREAGIPADVLRDRVDRLRETTFAATGISTCALEGLRPPPGNIAWQNVSEKATRAALKEARRDAVAQVIDALRAPQLKLEQALADEKFRSAVESWLLSRPVTSTDFQDDLEVRVTMAVDRDSLWEAIVDAAKDRKDITIQPDENARRVILDKISSSVIGSAVAKADGSAPATVHASVAIPSQPPRWVIEQVDAKGASRAVNGRLKTARAAENAGRDKLRGKIEELSLSRNLTLGDAAKRDPRVKAAIDRAVEHARPRKVNYLSDGGAEVSFTLDLRDLWYELEDR